MNIQTKIAGPLRRRAESSRNSECGTAKLDALDWINWWQDGGGYIHVRRDRKDEGETWHRVHPKPIAGYECRRVAVSDGIVFWLYDPIK